MKLAPWLPLIALVAGCVSADAAVRESETIPRSEPAAERGASAASASTTALENEAATRQEAPASGSQFAEPRAGVGEEPPEPPRSLFDGPQVPVSAEQLRAATNAVEAKLGHRDFEVVASGVVRWSNTHAGCRRPGPNGKRIVVGPQVIVVAKAAYVYVHNGRICDDPKVRHPEDPLRP